MSNRYGRAIMVTFLVGIYIAWIVTGTGPFSSFNSREPFYFFIPAFLIAIVGAWYQALKKPNQDIPENEESIALKRKYLVIAFIAIIFIGIIGFALAFFMPFARHEP